MQAGIDSQGNISTWSAKRTGPKLTPEVVPDAITTFAPDLVPDSLASMIGTAASALMERFINDPASVEGLYEEYDIPNKEVRSVHYNPGIRTGFWRSVGHSYTAFFKESFIDEIAHKTDQDPLELRLRHSKSDQRTHAVLTQLKDFGAWGKPLAAGHFHGLAVHTSFGTVVAQLAEVSVHGADIRVHKISCVVDCGQVINPDIVRAQIEGSVIFGLSAALYGEITLQNGAVAESNFHNYPVLRMGESPDIEVMILPSERPPSGIGEPGVPPVAPAVGNAVFAATRKRLRSLPLKIDSPA